MDIKAIIGAVPRYVVFVSQLLRSPPDTLKPYNDRGKIAPALVGDLVVGLCVAYAIVWAIEPSEATEGTPALLRLVGEAGGFWLPVDVVVVVAIVTIVFHVLARIFLAVHHAQGQEQQTPPQLAGTMQDSVNAALAFASVFAPALCAAALAANLVISPARTEPKVLFLVIASIPAVFTLAYFPWCLSATHPETNWTQAFVAVAVTLVVVYMTVLG